MFIHRNLSKIGENKRNSSSGSKKKKTAKTSRPQRLFRQEKEEDAGAFIYTSLYNYTYVMHHLADTAPPRAWAATTESREMQNGLHHSSAINGTTSAGADVDSVSAAWKHLKNVGRDDARPSDLYDLLTHSVRETQYSFQPQGVSTAVAVGLRPLHCVHSLVVIWSSFVLWCTVPVRLFRCDLLTTLPRLATLSGPRCCARCHPWSTSCLPWC
jgi:hypothetical protein